MRGGWIVLVVLWSLLWAPALSQEAWPVPLTRQSEGLLYFESGALQGPPEAIWVEVPNQSEHPLYVATGRDLLYNVLVAPDVSSVDQKGALKMLEQINPQTKVQHLASNQRSKPLAGVQVDYRLGKSVLGSIFLGKDSSGRVLALMGEGRRFERDAFVSMLDSFQPGAKPPTEWQKRALRPSPTVKEGVVHQPPLYFRVPPGLGWQESSDQDGTTLLAIRKEPFTLLAARVVPRTGQPLDDQAAVEGSEQLLRSMVTAHTGIAFRMEQRARLSTPLPDSWVLTATGQTLSGGRLPARVFRGFGEGFTVTLVAAGADDTKNLSLMHNSLSLQPLAPLATAPPTPVVHTMPQTLEEPSPLAVATTLVYVSFIVVFCSVVFVTTLVAVRNKLTDSGPLNPFAIGLKAAGALSVLQMMVSLWLLRQEGAIPEDYQTYLLLTWAGIAFCLIPTALLAGRWSRRSR